MTTVIGEPILMAVKPQQKFAFLYRHGWTIERELNLGDLGVPAMSGMTSFVVARPAQSPSGVGYDSDAPS
jgi:hypothetical protein